MSLHQKGEKSSAMEEREKLIAKSSLKLPLGYRGAFILLSSKLAKWGTRCFEKRVCKVIYKAP